MGSWNGCLSLILSLNFEEQIYSISSLFIGFIIFSIPLIIKAEKETIKGKYINSVWAVTGVLIVVALTVFNPASGGQGIDVSFGNLTIGLSLYVFVAGMIAISAMVLPGISGSTLLLIFGLYTAIIGAIKEVLSLNFSYLPVLVIFGVGVIVGILSTIKLIRHFLRNSTSANDLPNPWVNDWITLCGYHGANDVRSSKSANVMGYI